MKGDGKKKKTKNIANMWIANGPLHIDFWGPVSNFGIPVAAVMDTQKDPEMYVLLLSSLIVSRHACVIIELRLLACLLTCLIGYPASLSIRLE